MEWVRGGSAEGTLWGDAVGRGVASSQLVAADVTSAWSFSEDRLRTVSSLIGTALG
jgi:hypothetical protein